MDKDFDTAQVILLGDDWGETPLWRVEDDAEEPSWSVDVFAADEEEARQAAEDSCTATPTPSEATTNLVAAVEAVTSAPDFETAKANLTALVDSLTPSE